MMSIFSFFLTELVNIVYRVFFQVCTLNITKLGFFKILKFLKILKIELICRINLDENNINICPIPRNSVSENLGN